MGRRGWIQGGAAQEEARGALEVVVLAGARRPVLGLRRTPTKTEGMSGAVLLLGAEDDRCGRRCSRSSSPRALGRRGVGEEEAHRHRRRRAAGVGHPGGVAEAGRGAELLSACGSGGGGRWGEGIERRGDGIERWVCCGGQREREEEMGSSDALPCG